MSELARRTEDEQCRRKGTPLDAVIDNAAVTMSMSGCFPTGSGISKIERAEMNCRLQFHAPAGTPAEGTAVDFNATKKMEALWISLDP